MKLIMNYYLAFIKTQYSDNYRLVKAENPEQAYDKVEIVYPDSIEIVITEAIV